MDSSDEIDFQLLEKILDNLAKGIADPQIRQPSYHLIKQVIFEQHPAIHNILSTYIRSIFWSNPPDDLRTRIEICLTCKNNKCSHLRPDVLIDDCTHEEKWKINGICGQCILEQSDEEDSNGNTVKLWDSHDLVEYCGWINQFSLENGEFN